MEGRTEGRAEGQTELKQNLPRLLLNVGIIMRNANNIHVQHYK